MVGFYSFTSFSFELFPFHNMAVILSTYIEVVNNSIFRQAGTQKLQCSNEQNIKLDFSNFGFWSFGIV